MEKCDGKNVEHAVLSLSITPRTLKALATNSEQKKVRSSPINSLSPFYSNFFVALRLIRSDALRPYF